MCGTRLKARIAQVQERWEAETASIILQQEVLEFVLGNLEAFMAKTVVEYLENGLDSRNGMESNAYAWRFRDPTWAGVLNIVRWYVGSDFKLKWTMTEGKSSQRPMINDTMEFVNALCRHIENTGFLSQYRAFEGTINSDGFKKKLADFVWAQCKIDQKEPQDREDVGLSGRIVIRQTPVSTRPCYHGVDDSSPDEEVDDHFEKATSKGSHEATSIRSAVPPSAQVVGSGW